MSRETGLQTFEQRWGKLLTATMPCLMILMATLALVRPDLTWPSSVRHLAVTGFALPTGVAGAILLLAMLLDGWQTPRLLRIVRLGLIVIGFTVAALLDVGTGLACVAVGRYFGERSNVRAATRI